MLGMLWMLWPKVKIGAIFFQNNTCPVTNFLIGQPSTSPLHQCTRTSDLRWVEQRPPTTPFVFECSHFPRSLSSFPSPLPSPFSILTLHYNFHESFFGNPFPFTFFCAMFLLLTCEPGLVRTVMPTPPCLLILPTCCVMDGPDQNEPSLSHSGLPSTPPRV